jgi:hypothetical protein
VQRFAQKDPEDQQNIDIKRDHSLRVLKEAQGITASLDLNEPFPFMAHLAALFHDVGRFPQYEKHRTFNDKLSANHGRLSFRALKEEGVLNDLPKEQRRIILLAVLLHNRREVSERLSDDLKVVLQIVRDADKLDIFSVMLKHLDPQATQNKVVTLGLKYDPQKISPVIYEQVKNRGLAHYEDMVWVNDFKLLLCSWVYGLNFEYSRQALWQRGYLQRLFSYLPETEEIAELSRQLQADLLQNKSQESLSAAFRH